VPTFAVGYCHNGTVRAEFAHSMMMLTAAAPEGLANIYEASGLYIHTNRNNIVNAFLADNTAEWLVFIDTDIVFTPAQIEELLSYSAPHRQVLTGLYFLWSRMLQRFIPDWFSSLEPLTIADITKKNEAVPLAACGMGFTAIHRLVLMTMQEMRAGDPAIWFGYDRVQTLGGMAEATEDFTFCLRARAAGFKTWGVPVDVDHVKSCVENRASYAVRERA
jgi:hypothetical protein